MRFKVFYMKSSGGMRQMINDILSDVEDVYGDLAFSLSALEAKLKNRNDRRAWQYLLDAGLVEVVDKKKARLTDMAKINLFAQIVARRKPDGRTRLITFDIPEKKRGKRDALRAHLKELGFEQWQKSVWLSRVPCEDLVEIVIRYHDLGKYMKLFVGEPVQVNSRS